jgi:hypothetical protein
MLPLHSILKHCGQSHHQWQAELRLAACCPSLIAARFPSLSQLLCGSLPKRVAEITFVRARIADAHRDGKRFVVRSDELLTSFLELERAICVSLLAEQI